MTEIVKERRIN